MSGWNDGVKLCLTIIIMLSFCAVSRYISVSTHIDSKDSVSLCLFFVHVFVC